MYMGGKTPAYGGATPFAGNATPFHAGSSTPYAGGKTTAAGGNAFAVRASAQPLSSFWLMFRSDTGILSYTLLRWRRQRIQRFLADTLRWWSRWCLECRRCYSRIPWRTGCIRGLGCVRLACVPTEPSRWRLSQLSMGDCVSRSKLRCRCALLERTYARCLFVRRSMGKHIASISGATGQIGLGLSRARA